MVAGKGRDIHREESLDDGSSSFLFALSSHFLPTLSLSSGPTFGACARLNLAEAEDFQGKTCIGFYRRPDHLNNSQHGKPRATLTPSRTVSHLGLPPSIIFSASRGSTASPSPSPPTSSPATLLGAVGVTDLYPRRGGQEADVCVRASR
ncbi:hypothetical protein KM043_010947 [Ampulex compressa]|nr:hypothetical protein KM043_010947 [Ampulex compressa]